MFRCPRCKHERQLHPDNDARDCRCGALMRKKLAPPPSARAHPSLGNPDRVPLPPVWRCQACGGLHWHVLALVKICPVTGR